MDNQDNKTNSEVQSHTLNRALHPALVLGLSMADASPIMASVLLSIGIFSVGGSFGIVSCAIITFVVMMISLNLAELGAKYPLAGGSYSVVRAVLPGPFASITFFNMAFQGVFIPASLTLGIGQLEKLIFPDLPIPEVAVAFIALMLAFFVASMNIKTGAWTTVILMLIQVIVLVIIIGSAFKNPNWSIIEMIKNPVVLGDGGSLIPVTGVVMMATMVPTFSVINGYDSVLGFSEEIKGGPRTLGKTVVLAAFMASVLISAPLIAALLSAPDLVTFFESESPVVYAVDEAWGHAFANVVSVGVIIAEFSCCTTLLMYFGRTWYTSGRDGMWSKGINKKLSKLNKHQVPGNGILFLVACTAVLMFVSSLEWLIIFSGTMICTVYLFVGVAGFVSRIKDKDVERPFSIPLWPVPSLIVVFFNGFALITQETQFLIGEIIMIALALLCFVVFRKKGNQL